ncbi:hypothetical protein Fcan01_14571 [Folsomia candida]|uniref:Uncharacterized protein n=1 Tax=Folsomia candida TaxID=158441 RepID=A0A226E0R7_FOLCA|nr:hypothetical protein Fcan01_14571 [Folsomia candida]
MFAKISFIFVVFVLQIILHSENIVLAEPEPSLQFWFPILSNGQSSSQKEEDLQYSTPAQSRKSGLEMPLSEESEEEDKTPLSKPEMFQLLLKLSPQRKNGTAFTTKTVKYLSHLTEPEVRKMGAELFQFSEQVNHLLSEKWFEILMNTNEGVDLGDGDRKSGVEVDKLYGQLSVRVVKEVALMPEYKRLGWVKKFMVDGRPKNRAKITSNMY